MNRVVGNHTGSHLSWKLTSGGIICDFLHCEMRFKVKQILKRHKATHTGEKSYECDVCKKIYSRFDALQRHQKIHRTKVSFIKKRTVKICDNNKRDRGVHTNFIFTVKCSMVYITNGVNNFTSSKPLVSYTQNLYSIWLVCLNIYQQQVTSSELVIWKYIRVKLQQI
jgi:hypothetical protein